MAAHEGRQPNDVDPAFYLAAYPEMERDLGHAPDRGRRRAALHHVGTGARLPAERRRAEGGERRRRRPRRSVAFGPIRPMRSI